MAIERWVMIEVCRDGDARANTVEDGKLWLSGATWARVRGQKGVKVIQSKPVILNGVYTVVADEEASP